jgi:hypothetical protein
LRLQRQAQRRLKNGGGGTGDNRWRGRHARHADARHVNLEGGGDRLRLRGEEGGCIGLRKRETLQTNGKGDGHRPRR